MEKESNNIDDYIQVTFFLNTFSIHIEKSMYDTIRYLILNKFHILITSYNYDDFTENLIGLEKENIECQKVDKNTIDYFDLIKDVYCYDELLRHKVITDFEENFHNGCFYNKYELMSLDFIRNTGYDFDNKKLLPKLYEEFIKRDSQQFIDQGSPKNSNFDTPSWRQREYFNKDYLTIHDIACMLSNSDTESIKKYENETFFTSLFSEYIKYKLFIENSIEEKLLFKNDKGCINNTDVKKFLHSTGYIIKGYNDWLTIEPAKPLINNKNNQELKDDSQLLKEAQSSIENLEKEIAKLKSQLELQTITVANDKELASNSQSGVARMLYAILTEHGYDLSPPKGKGLANDLIVTASENHGTPVTRNFVANWLVRARQAKIDNTK